MYCGKKKIQWECDAIVKQYNNISLTVLTLIKNLQTTLSALTMRRTKRRTGKSMAKKLSELDIVTKRVNDMSSTATNVFYDKTLLPLFDDGFKNGNGTAVEVGSGTNGDGILQNNTTSILRNNYAGILQDNRAGHRFGFNLTATTNRNINNNKTSVSQLLSLPSSLSAGATTSATAATTTVVDKKDQESLKIVFDLFADNMELISYHNLERALRFLRFKVHPNQLFDTNLIEQNNYNNNNRDICHDAGDNHYGKLDFNAFCTCVVNLGSDWRDVRQEIECGYQKFDCESKGRITQQNLKHLNRKHGLGLTREEINEMILAMDLDGDGEILMDEFVTYMKESHIFSV